MKATTRSLLNLIAMVVIGIVALRFSVDINQGWPELVLMVIGTAYVMWYHQEPQEGTAFRWYLLLSAAAWSTVTLLYHMGHAYIEQRTAEAMAIGFWAMIKREHNKLGDLQPEDMVPWYWTNKFLRKLSNGIDVISIIVLRRSSSLLLSMDKDGLDIIRIWYDISKDTPQSVGDRKMWGYYWITTYAERLYGQGCWHPGRAVTCVRCGQPESKPYVVDGHCQCCQWILDAGDMDNVLPSLAVFKAPYDNSPTAEELAEYDAQMHAADKCTCCTTADCGMCGLCTQGYCTCHEELQEEHQGCDGCTNHGTPNCFWCMNYEYYTRD